jgi:hypothetical protein
MRVRSLWAAAGAAVGAAGSLTVEGSAAEADGGAMFGVGVAPGLAVWAVVDVAGVACAGWELRLFSTIR